MNDLHPIGDAVRVEASRHVPLLIPIKQAAEVLGCSSRTVRRRIHDGTLPAVLEQGRLMVRSDELLGYIDDLKHYGPARTHIRRRPAQRHVFNL